VAGSTSSREPHFGQSRQFSLWFAGIGC
jgi:hypothetical protein